MEEIERIYGLDRPIWEQYLKYLQNLLQGDLGTSITSRQPVTEEIGRRFPATIELAFAAMIFATTLGVPLGFFAAKRYGSVVDHGSLVASLIGISIPVFFLAILLKYVFAVQLGWLPTIGRQDVLINADHPTGFYVLDGIITLNFEAAWDAVLASHPAGDRARLDPARDHRAHHARFGARRPERGLRADGAREGSRVRASSTGATSSATRCSQWSRSSACRPACSSRARS